MPCGGEGREGEGNDKAHRLIGRTARCNRNNEGQVEISFPAAAAAGRSDKYPHPLIVALPELTGGATLLPAENAVEVGDVVEAA